MLNNSPSAMRSERPLATSAAIAMDDVTLVRRTQEELHHDLKRTVLRLLSGHNRRVKRRTVLENVSLQVERGEKVGIIGPNGSGKSTLLKVIAGILRPTRGAATFSGTLAPLLELGVGFDADLSLIDNIMYYGVLLGIPKSSCARTSRRSWTSPSSASIATSRRRRCRRGWVLD